jgi:hypothetical protein
MERRGWGEGLTGEVHYGGGLQETSVINEEDLGVG